MCVSLSKLSREYLVETKQNFTDRSLYKKESTQYLIKIKKNSENVRY